MGLEEGWDSPGSTPRLGQGLWHPWVALAGSLVPMPAAVVPGGLAGPCGGCFEARHWLSSFGGIRPPPAHSSALCPPVCPQRPPCSPLLQPPSSPVNHYPYWCLLSLPVLLSVHPRQRAAFIPPSSPSPAPPLRPFPYLPFPGSQVTGPRYDPARSRPPAPL